LGGLVGVGGLVGFVGFVGFVGLVRLVGLAVSAGLVGFVEPVVCTTRKAYAYTARKLGEMTRRR
jgi:hypothetical protein